MRRLFIVFAFIAALRGERVEHHLVEVRTIQPPLLQEIRYATRYNFTGEALYPFPGAWVNRDVARALEGVQSELAKQGLGLKIYDGYRPLSMQQKMWDLVRDERYVSNPAANKGRHTRGTAVDVTLVDRLGNELEMPTSFDDFTEAAHRDSETMTAAQRANMVTLQTAMHRHGFLPYPFEWWHYDFRDWQKYPVLDISYEDLARGVKTTVPVP